MVQIMEWVNCLIGCSAAGSSVEGAGVRGCSERPNCLIIIIIIIIIITIMIIIIIIIV